jgi:hypothetical protein
MGSTRNLAVILVLALSLAPAAALTDKDKSDCEQATNPSLKVAADRLPIRKGQIVQLNSKPPLECAMCWNIKSTATMNSVPAPIMAKQSGKLAQTGVPMHSRFPRLTRELS